MKEYVQIDTYNFTLQIEDKEFLLNTVRENKVVRTTNKIFLVIDSSVINDDLYKYITSNSKTLIFDISGETLGYNIDNIDNGKEELRRIRTKCELKTCTQISKFGSASELKLVFECVENIEL